jgi:ATP-dependent RNA helicase DeaD
LLPALERRGFSELTRIQRAVLDVRAKERGRNLRLTSQTGSGKTLALGFALHDTLMAEGELEKPATKLAPRTPASLKALIIVPTRELANQVCTELSWLYADCPKVSLDVVTGGTDVRADQRRLRRGPALLVGTPGRLLDHLRSGVLDLSAVQEVVLDEADQMLDMGFREELEALLEALPDTRRSHLVSATFPPGVVRLAKAFQSDPLLLEGTKLGAANSDIAHVAHLIHLRDSYAALVNVLLANTGSRCLVFVQRRSDAASLAEALAADGFAALPLSGELPQAQRTRTLAAFKANTVEILVATDVAARGIHVDDVGVVVHTDFPREVDAYTHRSGRTGRAGQKGLSVSLVVPQAKRRVEAMTKRLGIELSWQPLPAPKKIRRRNTKQMRRALHDRLAGPEPDQGQLEYAEELMTRVPPQKLIAVLLQMAEPPLPTAPREVKDAQELAPRQFTRGDKPRGERPRGGKFHGTRGRVSRPANMSTLRD